MKIILVIAILVFSAAIIDITHLIISRVKWSKVKGICIGYLASQDNSEQYGDIFEFQKGNDTYVCFSFFDNIYQPGDKVDILVEPADNSFVPLKIFIATYFKDIFWLAISWFAIIKILF